MKGKAKLTAMDVANFFIFLAIQQHKRWKGDKDEFSESNQDETLTHIKIQKLLYYAQGFYLASFGKRLFADKIYAWQHGPVVKSVYSQLKEHGNSFITTLPGGFSEYDFDAEIREFLEEVYVVYGQFSAVRLRSMTHEAGSPWDQVYQGKSEKDVVIPTNIIKEHFKAMQDR